MKALWSKQIFKLAFIALLMSALTWLTGCSNATLEQHLHTSPTTNSVEQQQIQSNEAYTTFEEVAEYLRTYGELPTNYITKEEARKLGWVAAEGNLHDVAPGMSIGGDRFGNREGLLPNKEGRIWYEADINYEGGRRNADRIVYSSDGLIYMTTDHYESFKNITEGMN